MVHTFATSDWWVFLDNLRLLRQGNSQVSCWTVLSNLKGYKTKIKKCNIHLEKEPQRKFSITKYIWTWWTTPSVDTSDVSSLFIIGNRLTPENPYHEKTVYLVEHYWNLWNTRAVSQVSVFDVHSVKPSFTKRILLMLMRSKIYFES